MIKTKPAITAKELFDRADEITGLYGRGVATDALIERLTGVMDAIQFMQGKKSYALGWVEQAEKEIREHHKKFGPRMGRIAKNAIITEEPGEHPACDCGVCRRAA